MGGRKLRAIIIKKKEQERFSYERVLGKTLSCLRSRKIKHQTKQSFFFHLFIKQPQEKKGSLQLASTCSRAIINVWVN